MCIRDRTGDGVARLRSRYIPGSMDQSGEDETPSDTPEVRRRIGATLAQHLWLRFHVGLLVGSTVLVGFIASVVQSRYEPLQTALGLRYALSSLLAYGWFLLCVRWWVKYFAGIRPRVGDPDEDRGRFEIRAVQGDKGTDFGRSTGRREPDGCGDGCADPSGCLDFEGFLVVGVFLALFFSVFWIFSAGPVILIEIATDTLLAGGLLRWARRTEETWMSRSVRNTIIPFGIATASLFIFGVWARYRCPTATRIGEVWACLW